MASNVYTSAGTKLYISATLPATEDQAGYEALTWTEIGDLSDFGEYGRQYAEVTFNPIGDRKTYKSKGSYNDGNLTLQMARAPYADAGQAIVKTALDDDNNYSFKAAHNNIATTTGTVEYFPAKVMSYTTSGISGPDSNVMSSVGVSIDGAIVEVDPT